MRRGLRLRATRAAGLSVLCALLLTLITGLPSAMAENAPQIASPHAILVDFETGTVLFERGADDLVAPASTAKLMTAEMVFARLKAGTLQPTQTFKISETAWRQGGAPSHGSTMFAKLNSEVSIEDLLRGLIVDSANDAAIALAEGIAGSQGAFSVLMTRRAHELGFTHLSFTDAWGNANPDQNVTAREMALLARHIIKTYPDLYKLFGEKEFLWNKIKQPNRNPLLSMDIGADGLKTGNIGDSGYSIVGSAVENGQRLIVAIYGADKAGQRADDARKLLQWGFRTFEARRLFAAGDVVGSAQVHGGQARSVPLVATREVKVLVPRDGSGRLSAKISYIGPLMAPVEADSEVATLKLYLGAAEVLSVPLRTASAVPLGSLQQRALDAGLSYFGDLFRKYVLRS